jgi:hypothetical protein
MLRNHRRISFIISTCQATNAIWTACAIHVHVRQSPIVSPRVFVAVSTECAPSIHFVFIPTRHGLQNDLALGHGKSQCVQTAIMLSLGPW